MTRGRSTPGVPADHTSGRPGDGTPGPVDEPVFTHLDATGRARMVDVTGKAVTERQATARCVVRASPGALEAARKEEDFAPFARAAGIHGAKQAPALIPLCHPLPLDDVDIVVDIDVTSGKVDVRATTSVVARTGIEIEALSACAFAGLTLLMSLRIYDQDATLSTLSLWHKSGGRTGTWQRVAATDQTDLGSPQSS